MRARGSRGSFEYSHLLGNKNLDNQINPWMQLISRYSLDSLLNLVLKAVIIAEDLISYLIYNNFEYM